MADMDAGSTTFGLLGEGGKGRSRISCREMADDELAAQFWECRRRWVRRGDSGLPIAA